jgi:hypothetical protein
MPETLKDKIFRHLKEGQIDPATVGRGVHTAFGHLMARNEEQGELSYAYTKPDFYGVSGLSLTHYDFQRGNLGLDSFLKGIAHLYPAEFKIYEFPFGARVEPILTGKDLLFETKDLVDIYPRALATFTGPTYKSYVKMPNNGFYHQTGGELVDFADTNPPGGRRGALAITDHLNPVVIDDRLKWAVKDAEYPGIQALVGTSNYFNGAESENDIVDPDTGKINGSYLFQYLDSSDQIRMGFVVSACIGARRTMKRVLDDYVSRQNGQGYFAIELELASAQCVVKGPEGKHIYGSGFKNRRDHYLVLPPQSSDTGDEMKSILSEQMRPYLTRDIR